MIVILISHPQKMKDHLHMDSLSVGAKDPSDQISFLIKSNLLRALAKVWDGWRQETGEIPYKTDVDPIQLGKAGLLSHIWIAERLTPHLFRFRLAGERMNTAYGRTIAGLMPQDLFDAAAARHVVGQWTQVLDDRVVIHSQGTVLSSSGIRNVGERIILPLAAPDGTPQYLIGVSDLRVPGDRPDALVDDAAYCPDIEHAVPIEDVSSILTG